MQAWTLQVRRVRELLLFLLAGGLLCCTLSVLSNDWSLMHV